MRYLITGGAGFIGSHLTERLLASGHEVCVLDDLSTGSVENISKAKPHKNFKYFIDTATNRGLLAELVDSADAVFHLAAAVGVRLIVESPVRTIETNIRTTELVLECATKKRKRVLLASTSEVYGKSQAVPFREDGDLVLGPTDKGRWSYACSKALDEYLCLAYWKEKRCPVTIVRLFNTVGPRQTGLYGMVLPNFVRQALSGQPITVFGDGEQSRCFLHVKDCTWALERLISNESTIGETFNIGSEQEISIKALANLVKERAHSKSEVRFVPYAEAYEAGFEDMHRRVPDLSKINRLIGFSPRKDLACIVDDVIASFRGETIEPSSSSADGAEFLRR